MRVSGDPAMHMPRADGVAGVDQSLKRRVTLAQILKLDAVYYAGVTTMVAFWLWVGGTEGALAGWTTFAASYLLVVMGEPLLTWTVVAGLKLVEDKKLVQNLFVVKQLTTD